MNPKLFKIIKRHTMLNKRKLSFLYDSTINIIRNKIQGDIVECGVWMGGAVALIAKTLMDNKDIRTLRMFDSFDDPHEPLPVDGDRVIKNVGGMEFATGKMKALKGYYKRVTHGIGPGNPKVVYNLLVNIVGYPKDKIKIYKGWVQKTLPVFGKRIDTISMLILDCDLYEPQKLCLECLYPKVVKSGFVVVDDYIKLDGCRLAIDGYLNTNKITDTIQRANGTGCITWRK